MKGLFNYRNNGEFMSVLIKNMEMPKNCMCCPFPSVGTDAFYCHCPTMDGKEYDFKQANSRPFDCPLVEIPEHHGRIIDEDEIIVPSLSSWADQAIVADAIMDAPTIIKAE